MFSKQLNGKSQLKGWFDGFVLIMKDVKLPKATRKQSSIGVCRESKSQKCMRWQKVNHLIHSKRMKFYIRRKGRTKDLSCWRRFTLTRGIKRIIRLQRSNWNIWLSSEENCNALPKKYVRRRLNRFNWWLIIVRAKQWCLTSLIFLWWRIFKEWKKNEKN